jgi:hypothetical protein
MLGGLTGAADAIKNMADKARELKEQFQSGKLSAGELTEKLISSVPVVGQFWEAGKAIRSLFEGDNSPEAGFARANEQAKMLETVSKSAHELMKQMADGAHELDTYLAEAAKEMAKLTLNAHDADTAIADIALQQSLDNIEIEKKARIKAAEEAAKPAIDASRAAVKALQPGDSSDPNAVVLTAWEKFSTSNNDAKAAHMERAQTADIARNAEMQAEKLKLAAIAQAEAEAAKKIKTAKELAAQRTVSTAQEEGAKHHDIIKKQADEIASEEAETQQTLLEAQGKKYQAELVALRAALAKRLDEIKNAAKEEAKTYGQKDKLGRAGVEFREGGAEQAAHDVESAKEAAARKAEQDRQQKQAEEMAEALDEPQKAMREEAKKMNEESLTAAQKYVVEMQKVKLLHDEGLISDQAAAMETEKAAKAYASAHELHQNAGAAETRRMDFHLARVTQQADPQVKVQMDIKRDTAEMARYLQQLYNFGNSANQNIDVTVDLPGQRGKRMAWTSIWQDINKLDQAERTVDPKSLSITDHISQTWFALSDTVAVSATEAQFAATGEPIPTAGLFYTIGGLNWMLCTHVMAQRVADNPKLFAVQVEYVRTIALQPGDKWAIQISFTGEKYTQDAFVDSTGAPVTNSAGQSFSPSLKKDYFDEQISVSYKTVSPIDLADYYGTVNSDTVAFTISGISKSYSERQLRFDNGTYSTSVTLGDGVTDVTASTPVWDVKLTFTGRSGTDEFGNPNTFEDHVLDEGLMQLDASGAVVGATPDCTADNLINIKDKFGNDVSTAVRLDGSGQPLPPCGAPHFITYKIEDEHTLSELFDGLS